MEILYSDSGIVVCVKPVGLDSEIQVPEEIKMALGGEVLPVHRLDKNVGGVMVYARTKQAAATLSKSIQEGTMVKEYVALVHGIPPQSGDWEDLLWKDSTKNKVFVVKRQRGGVKRARLEYTCLRSEDPSLVGDHKYGARDEISAPALFSCCIAFPWKGGQRRFEALPDWAK